MSDQPWVCAPCGGSNPAGTAFCGHCGARAAPAPDAGARAAPAAAVDTPVQTAGAGAAPAPAHLHADGSPVPADRETAANALLRSFVASDVADRLLQSGGHFSQERRLVTALFADLSGFSTLASELDAEQLLDVIDPLIARLVQVVAEYEGYVEKFAGDALLALFGAPVTHDDDAARALLVALEMHRALPTLPTAALHADMHLHIGVDSGHVIARLVGSELRMDYAVLGDAVVLAQRLESLTPPGQTYVGEETYRLTRDRFLFEPVGDLPIKGRSEPAPAWRLLGERARGRVLDLGARLVGRQDQLVALDGLLSTPAQAPRLVAVVGEPGIGKSRLLAEVRAARTARGVRWLEAGCVPYGEAQPYRPYADVLRNELGVGLHDPAGRVQARLDAELSTLGLDDVLPPLRTLLGLAGGAPADDPEVRRHDLQEAVLRWVARLAASAPVVLVLEDVHWADEPTLRLTALLASLRDADVRVCVTGRPQAREALQSLQRAVGDYRELLLAELPPQDVEALVADLLGGPVAPDVLTAVAERVAGNPLFAHELVRSLKADGVLARAPQGWAFTSDARTVAVPATVEGVLSARIDALPAAAVTVLHTAAVIGRRVRRPLLAAVVDPGTDLAEALDVLVESGLLARSPEDPDELVLEHALVQEVAYGRRLRKQRRDLHRAVAESAELLYGVGDDTVDLLARHLYLGEVGARAVPFLQRAGARAAALFANAEAVVHYTRAAEVAAALPDDQACAARLPEIRLALAGLHERLGHYADSLALYEQVRLATDDVRAWLGSASSLRHAGHFDEALDLLLRATALPGLLPATRAALELERGQALLAPGRFAEAAHALRTGLALPDVDPGTRGHLLLQLANAELDMGRAEDALDHALAASERLAAAEDVRGSVTALRALGGVRLRLGRLDDAASALGEGLARAEQVGLAEEVAACLLNLGLVELERGRHGEAIAYDRRAVEQFRLIGIRHGEATASANLAEALLADGQPEEALRWVDRAVELARGTGDTATLADATLTRAEVLLRDGDAAGAARAAEEAAEGFRAVGAAPFAVRAQELAQRARQQSPSAGRAQR